MNRREYDAAATKLVRAYEALLKAYEGANHFARERISNGLWGLERAAPALKAQACKQCSGNYSTTSESDFDEHAVQMARLGDGVSHAISRS